MDCTGHVVPGALMSILGTTLLDEIVLREQIIEPDKVLKRLNKKLISSLRQKEVSTVIMDGIEGSVIQYNPSSRLLKYSGLNNPLILVRNNSIIKIKPEKKSLVSMTIN